MGSGRRCTAVRIAFFHNHPSGGAARALHELGQQLAPRHDVDVYTLATGDEEALSSADYARKVTSIPFEERHPIRLGFYLNDWRRYRDLSALERASRDAAKAIDAEAYDVVLANACRFLQSPAVLPYLTTPSAYYCHEPPRRFLQQVCAEDVGPLTTYQRLRSWWHKPARIQLDSVIKRRDRRNFAAAGAVLTNSRFTADLIGRYYGREATVCRLGVDAERFHPADATRGDYVLSVGALEPHKGFDFLVRSVGLLTEESRPELRIVANYVNPGVATDLRRLAEARGVSLSVMEAVDEDELVAQYQQARVFAYAPHEEPFGLAVLEAMACGLPVVAVAEGGVLESIRPGESGLVTNREEQAFAEALSRVTSDGELAQSLGGAGRRSAVTDWTWDAAGRRLESHLADVAGADSEVLSALPDTTSAQGARSES